MQSTNTYIQINRMNLLMMCSENICYNYYPFFSYLIAFMYSCCVTSIFLHFCAGKEKEKNKEKPEQEPEPLKKEKVK